MGIENTSREKPQLAWLTPAAMEAQEIAGQQLLAASSQLPLQGLDQAAATLGITVHGSTLGDPLFGDVTLPDGWTIVPTQHAMWSELRDGAGVTRAEIFYKAAFYDRRAFIRVHHDESHE